MKLEEIGFYTLSDERAKHTSVKSRLQRCEMILTDRCNFKCPYCRGLRSDIQGDMPFDVAMKTLRYWTQGGLKNIRFSGGEPTLYKGLEKLVSAAKKGEVNRIALSTNGSASLDKYLRLIELGVNDFSISLDGGCCSMVEIMTGGVKSWDRIVNNIRELSKLTYVSVGMVFTEQNVEQARETVLFARALGVKDIRVIPSAQFNKALENLSSLPDEILNDYPILKYRINNLKKGKHVRGMSSVDNHQCPLVIDDMAVSKDYHFPCIIYMREAGDPIGKMEGSIERVREQRYEWMKNHNCYEDNICRKNCLDVCIDYNNAVKKLNKEVC